MIKVTATIFYVRSTKNSHIYESTDKRVIHYWPRAMLTNPPPDVLVVDGRTPTPDDLGEH